MLAQWKVNPSYKTPHVWIYIFWDNIIPYCVGIIHFSHDGPVVLNGYNGASKEFDFAIPRLPNLQLEWNHGWYIYIQHEISRVSGDYQFHYHKLLIHFRAPFPG